MNEDIINRLLPFIHDEMRMPAGMIKDVIEEIERLRAEVSRLMQVICDSSPDDDYFLIRQEADLIWKNIHNDTL